MKIGNLQFKMNNGKFVYKIGENPARTLFGKAKKAEDAYDDQEYNDVYDDSYDDSYDQGYDSREELYSEYEYDDDEQEKSQGFLGSVKDVFSNIIYFFKDHKWLLIVIGLVLLAVIVLIILLDGNGKDDSKLPMMTLTSVTPTLQATSEPITDEPATDDTIIGNGTDGTGEGSGEGSYFDDVDFGDDETGGDTSVEPSPTPHGYSAAGTEGGTGDETGLTGNVYSPQTGLYYHMDSNCSKIDAGVQVTLVTLQAAENRSQSPCPLCCGGTVYYATADGKYYHTNRYCTGMTTATEYSKEAAIAEGKKACPTCAGGKEEKPAEEQSKGQKYVSTLTNDKSGIKVYMTKKGKWYHTESDCQGMTGARQTTLLKALQDGKEACPKCSSGANVYVYCTTKGTYYHASANCGSMKNGSKVTLALAKVLGKSQCPDCISEDFYKKADKKQTKTEDDKKTSTDDKKTDEKSKEPSSDKKDDSGDGKKTDNSPVIDDSEAYVYATDSGSYYHSSATCSDMKNAKKVTLKSMLKAGRKACPKCCGNADKPVYVTANGSYYHSYAGCSAIKDPQTGTMAQAIAHGYSQCPKCWGSNEGGNKNEDDANNGYSDVYVYATENGKVYHAKKNCSKASSDVTKVLLEQAIDDGKSPCSACAANASTTVYAVKGGSVYHKDKNCNGMTNAAKGTLAQALAKGLEPCKFCAKSTNNNVGDEKKTPTKYKSGTSGKKVYCTTGSNYYHKSGSCSLIGNKSVAYVTLEAALNNGRSACPKCSSGSKKTVYATKNGKYYHYSSSCAGSKASSGKLDAAMAMGYKACPVCVTGKGTSNDTKTYKPGTSGIKVYVCKSSKNYHWKGDCEELKNPQYVSLETAMNNGLSACKKCTAGANTKVFVQSGSSRYHFSSACAGSAAKAGTLAQALALGLKPCTNCVVPDENTIEPTIGGNDDDDEERKAPASTLVYVDLSENGNDSIYHKDGTCDRGGLKDGSEITLVYALDHSLRACPYCKPANTIE